METKADTLDIGFPYYRFGSHDSRDIDILIDHESATGLEIDKDLIKTLVNIYPQIGAWNINIIRIENGSVLFSIPSKGSPDAVNNSLFDTYHFHTQDYPFPLRYRMRRNTLLAIVKCVKNLLFAYKGTKNNDYYKKICRPILLKGTFVEQVQLLSQLDFSQSFSDDIDDTLNRKKSLLFRVGQTIALLQNIEIYTKSDLKANFPEMAPIIDREANTSPAIFYKYVQALQAAVTMLEIQENKVDEVSLDTDIVNYRLETIVVKTES